MRKVRRIILAPDSFKESMSAIEVCDALQRGIEKANPNIKCISIPMADGGEGTVDSLISATSGVIHKLQVKGPLGNQVDAEYGILGCGKVAVIEMASASGIQLIHPEHRNPMKTSTYGTGQLIKECLNHSVEKILVGIGGSATNDGGTGMIQALGGKFIDINGNELQMCGEALSQIHSIDLSELDKRLTGVKIEVACDVNNPLTGENGASYVFGPQKGATPEMVKRLDNNLKHYGDIIKSHKGFDVGSIPGSGAAGGLGAGLLAFLNASLKKGIDMVIEYTKLNEAMEHADLVITGEGSIDYQTLYGKAPFGVSQVAKKYNVPVIAIAGKVGEGAEMLYENGMDSIFSIMQGVSTLEEALSQGIINVEKTGENIIRLIDKITSL